MKIDRSIVFGKKAKHTYWGLIGCSHGMYSRGGYDLYIYGIKSLFNVKINKTWGSYAK